MLRKPVRNVPTPGSRHQCGLTATVEVDGKETEVNLQDELACRQANLENGMIFTCEDIVTVAGKTGVCGKEWVLHYPTKFAWKVRRTNAKSEEAETTQTETATQPEPETAKEPATQGRRRH